MLLDEQMKVLSAELDEYSETGEIEQGSLLGELLDRARAEDRAVAVARMAQSQGRSPVVRYLGRSRGHRMSKDLEASFASVASLDQALLYRLFDFIGEVTLLAEDGGEAAIERMRGGGRELVPVQEVIHPAAFAALVAFTETIELAMGFMEERETHDAVYLRPNFIEQARAATRVSPPLGRLV